MFAFSFLFFKVHLPQTTKEPVSEVSKMTGIRALLLLSIMLAWDPANNFPHGSVFK